MKFRTNALSAKLLQIDRQNTPRSLRSDDLDEKAFGQKWYDVLSRKFYVEEYVAIDGSQDCDCEEKSFDTFDEYYKYIEGDVYEGACYYGYHFTEEEISKYSLDLKRLNFDSFEKKTVSSLKWSYAPKFDVISASRKAKEVFDWIEACPLTVNVEQLEKSLENFVAKFGKDWRRIFLSTILRRDKESAGKAIADYLCKKGFDKGVSFGDILFTFGWDAALEAIESYRASGGMERVVENLETAMMRFNEGNLRHKRVLGFDFHKQLYFAKEEYPGCIGRYLETSNWFLAFDDFVSFVDGDLREADLRCAPLSEEDVLSCKTNSETKFPVSEGKATTIIDKKYDGRLFSVEKVWLDEYGNSLHQERRDFRHFFDFAHFLKGDLSGADLVFCDGIENLSSVSGLKFDGAKVRSAAAEALGLPLDLFPGERLETSSFEASERNELATKESFMLDRPDEEEYSADITYVSDIHLQHRFAVNGCKTKEDVYYVLHSIARTIAQQRGRGFGFNLIGGDTSSDFATFRSFVSKLHRDAELREHFFVLGNHELWPFAGQTFDWIVEIYREALAELGEGRIRLVQNNMFYRTNHGWNELSESELSLISESDLRKKTRGAETIVFGGLGFAGANEKFNADSGMYFGSIDRKQEIELSARFLKVYQKVASALRGRQVIVLTHMPMSDWGGRGLKPEDGFVYVNGHSHRNHFHDDGKTRVFADNQIGYKGKAVSLKKIPIDFGFDWFADCPDGIHEIAREDYSEYYRGIGEHMCFKRDFAKLYLLKKSNVHMFLLLDKKGQLKLLNGGMPKKVGNHDLAYFYEHMANYAKSVNLLLAHYCAFQKQVSSEVKKIGGSGEIHGAIVDINFFNHLYINCLDGSITPYIAYSMTDKYVYKNLGSLLHHECPGLYKKYKELITKGSSKGALVIRNENLAISNEKTWVKDTEMYRISRMLKSLQFTTKHNLIRVWSDSLAGKPSEENGKRIMAALLENTK